MALEELLYVPKSEFEIVRDVANELQRRFILYRALFFFIKLERCENANSQAVWIRTFLDYNSLLDFFYNTQLQRSSILVMFRESDYFEIFATGFSLRQELEVFTDKIVEKRRYEVAYNLEELKMFTREELAQMMQQMGDAITSIKRREAV